MKLATKGKVASLKAGHRLTLSLDGGKTSFECDCAESLALNIAIRVHPKLSRISIWVKTKRWGHVGRAGLPKTFSRGDALAAWEWCLKSQLMWLRQDFMVGKIVRFSAD